MFLSKRDFGIDFKSEVGGPEHFVRTQPGNRFVSFVRACVSEINGGFFPLGYKNSFPPPPGSGPPRLVFVFVFCLSFACLCHPDLSLSLSLSFVCLLLVLVAPSCFCFCLFPHLPTTLQTSSEVVWKFEFLTNHSPYYTFQ